MNYSILIRFKTVSKVVADVIAKLIDESGIPNSNTERTTAQGYVDSAYECYPKDPTILIGRGVWWTYGSSDGYLGVKPVKEYVLPAQLNELIECLRTYSSNTVSIKLDPIKGDQGEAVIDFAAGTVTVGCHVFPIAIIDSLSKAVKERLL